MEGYLLTPEQINAITLFDDGIFMMIFSRCTVGDTIEEVSFEEFDPENPKNAYERMTVIPEIAKPTLEEMQEELAKYKQELLDIWNEHERRRILRERIEALRRIDASMPWFNNHKPPQNIDLYFNTRIEDAFANEELNILLSAMESDAQAEKPIKLLAKLSEESLRLRTKLCPDYKLMNAALDIYNAEDKAKIKKLCKDFRDEYYRCEAEIESGNLQVSPNWPTKME